MWNNIFRFFNTIIYLKPIQLFYLFFYRMKNLFYYKKKFNSKYKFNGFINWHDQIFSLKSYNRNLSFNFLNISKHFSNKIDWNFSEHGKLWVYNLNYFDFLNQQEISAETGVKLIKDYVKNKKNLKDGREPYPISLRGINWIKFLSKNKIKNSSINTILHNDYSLLNNNLEYHLLGNHLLENAFSLLFGAYYFKNCKFYNKSKKLLILELEEQILSDGGHFELSPMYHQIIFSRLLDCIYLIKLNPLWQKDDLLSFLENKASYMNSWLYNITYKNGNIPMVNDSTFNIAHKSEKLFSYAKHLNIKYNEIPLSSSGYRKISNDTYELFLDIGNIGPNYQPGHSHSDTFNFELIKNSKPVFVDSGISTYEKNKKRQIERSTCSHNTVEIGGENQTDVWGGFRVAKRANITKLEEKSNFIEASHNGYVSQGYIHTRSFLWEKKEIILIDKISKSTSNTAKAFFHLHSSLAKPLVSGKNVILKSLEMYIEFESASKIYIEEYQLSKGFNKSSLAFKIVVIFDQILKTKIKL